MPPEEVTSEGAASPAVSRSHGLHIRSVRKESRQADFVASTPAIDSYGEIVEQSWDLSRFKTNPVILFAHQSRELPIGQAVSIGLNMEGNLECTIQFCTADANPLGEQVWQCVLQEVLRAVSVGFNPGTVRLEKRDGQDVYVLAQNKLFEISVTPIGANEEALRKMKMKAKEAAASKTPQTSAERQPMKENRMTPEELKAFIALRDGEVTALRTTNTELTKGVSDAQAATKAVTAERDAATAKAKALETERDASLATAKAANLSVVSSQLDALIGVKIDPSEKEGLVEVFELSPKTYEKQLASIKARPDLKTLGAVIPKDPEPVNKADDSIDSNGGDFAREATRRANANA